MAYAALISLRRTMEDLINSPRISISPLSLEIMRFAYKELFSLQETLERLDNTSKSYCRKKVNAVDTKLKEAVWKFEDLFESHFSNQILPQFEIDGGGAGATLLQVDLHELGEYVNSFIKMVKKMEEEYIYELHHLSPQEDFEGDASSSIIDSDAKKSKMVGSSLLNEIKDELNRYYVTSVITIVAMAGIGKTMIAKQIFHDELRKYPYGYGFDCRAWVTIGRNYRVNKLQLDILLQLDPDMVKSMMEGDVQPDLGPYWNQIMKTKKCLIVLDDVWDLYILDHLKSFLQKDGTSRVLLTTRLRDVAQHAVNHFYGRRYTMQLMNKDESWNLLPQRVFGEELCPPELERDGKKIAENCDGLPLMIVTVVESLSKAEKTAEYWKYVAEKKTCSIFMDAYDKISEVLFPSYEYLPQRLKPCFVQMGVFPPSYEISQNKLYNIWISERLLDPDIKHTYEECAVIYLWRLLDHNVVMTSQESSYMDHPILHYIKTCRLHSSFWYLCLKEAWKNKFFHVLSSPEDIIDESMKGQRRLSIHNNLLFGINNLHDSVVDACVSTTRSLLCYGPYNPFEVPISFNLRLLRVLDALQIRFYEFPLQVLQLIHLKYLAMTCNNKLPPSISKLFNLQFLIIHRHMSIKSQGDTSYVPIEIWDMQELRHIQIMGSNLPSPRGETYLESLLKLLCVSAETCTKEVLERIPNLRKLGIQIELQPDDDLKALHSLSHVNALSELSSLKCVVVNPILRSEIVSLPPPVSMFPLGLEKLHLSGLGYPWEYMSIIGSLQKLKVLKLRFYAFRGPKWEIKKDSFHFPSLKYLLIEDSDLVEFKVATKGFQSITTLFLKDCYKLEYIWWEDNILCPKIEVIDCSPSTVTFASQMRRRSEYYDDPNGEVSVHCSWKDRNLNSCPISKMVAASYLKS